jgi:membrane protein
VTTPFTSVFASIITLVFTAIGTIGAYGVLQDTMNEIWGLNQRKLNLFQRLKGKILPFLLVSVLGLTIMLWTGITTFLLEFITLALVPLISSSFSVFLRIIQIALSFVLATILFAVMYRQIPDLPIKWRDVILAATITGLLFTVTNYLFGVVLEVITITSVTRAAGSVMILLLWIFLVAQFVFYGVAFSQVYAEKVGSYSLNNRDST